MLIRRIGGFLGLALVIAVVATVILVVLEADDGDDVALRVGFHPFTSDPENGDCAGARRGPNDCDPVNLVFEGMSLELVTQALREAGWGTVGLGSTQWLAFEDTAGLTAQGTQLFLSESLSERFHVRLWGAPGRGSAPVVIGAVHHEQGVLAHRIDQDWEAAEARVRAMLCSGTTLVCEMGEPIVGQLAIQGDDGRWRGWANDGRPTVVRPAAGGAANGRR